MRKVISSAIRILGSFIIKSKGPSDEDYVELLKDKNPDKLLPYMDKMQGAKMFSREVLIVDEEEVETRDTEVTEEVIESWKWEAISPRKAFEMEQEQVEIGWEDVLEHDIGWGANEED